MAQRSDHGVPLRRTYSDSAIMEPDLPDLFVGAHTVCRIDSEPASAINPAPIRHARSGIVEVDYHSLSSDLFFYMRDAYSCREEGIEPADLQHTSPGELAESYHKSITKSILTVRELEIGALQVKTIWSYDPTMLETGRVDLIETEAARAGLGADVRGLGDFSGEAFKDLTMCTNGFRTRIDRGSNIGRVEATTIFVKRIKLHPRKERSPLGGCNTVYHDLTLTSVVKLTVLIGWTGNLLARQKEIDVSAEAQRVQHLEPNILKTDITF